MDSAVGLSGSVTHSPALCFLAVSAWTSCLTSLFFIPAVSDRCPWGWCKSEAKQVTRSVSQQEDITEAFNHQVSSDNSVDKGDCLSDIVTAKLGIIKEKLQPLISNS